MPRGCWIAADAPTRRRAAGVFDAPTGRTTPIGPAGRCATLARPGHLIAEFIVTVSGAEAL
jgi:hypothetical protein